MAVWFLKYSVSLACSSLSLSLSLLEGARRIQHGWDSVSREKDFRRPRNQRFTFAIVKSAAHSWSPLLERVILRSRQQRCCSQPTSPRYAMTGVAEVSVFWIADSLAAECPAEWPECSATDLSHSESRFLFIVITLFRLLVHIPIRIRIGMHVLLNSSRNTPRRDETILSRAALLAAEGKYDRSSVFRADRLSSRTRYIRETRDRARDRYCRVVAPNPTLNPPARCSELRNVSWAKES